MANKIAVHPFTEAMAEKHKFVMIDETEFNPEKHERYFGKKVDTGPLDPADLETEAEAE